MKKLFLAFALSSFIFTTACDDEDGTNAPILSDELALERITFLQESNDSPSDIIYEYNSQGVSKIIWDGFEQDFNPQFDFSYSDGRIKEINARVEDDEDLWIVDLVFEYLGDRIVKNYKDYYYSDEDTTSYNQTLELLYLDDYITSVKYTDYDNEGNEDIVETMNISISESYDYHIEYNREDDYPYWEPTEYFINVIPDSKNPYFNNEQIAPYYYRGPELTLFRELIKEIYVSYDSGEKELYLKADYEFDAQNRPILIRQSEDGDVYQDLFALTYKN
jgi:hypothetical protein